MPSISALFRPILSAFRYLDSFNFDSVMRRFINNLRLKKTTKAITGTPEEGDDKNDESDVETDPELGEREPRFEYSPKSFIAKLFTSLGGKTRLASSKIIQIEYRAWIRWVLVILLALITVFLTPQLLPKWLNFKWSTTSDLCSSRTKKLEQLQDKMNMLANITTGQQFVHRTNQAFQCMQTSARDMWGGSSIRRVSFPDECIPAKAKAPTKSKTVCTGGQKFRKCVRFLGIPMVCRGAQVPRKCQTYRATDPDAAKKISDLNSQWKAQQAIDSINPNETNAKISKVTETADKEGEKLITRLVTQVDIASNLYIVYTMVAVIVGTPVVIYKRERSAQVIGAALGLRKANFIVLVIVILTLYDTGAKMMYDVNFVRLFHNFQNDPCYLDPEFSRTRLDLIRYTCGNVTEQQTALNQAFSNMTRLFYSTQLCEVSQVGAYGPNPNRSLVSTIDIERQRFTNGTYKYPGNCNATLLNEATSTPPDNGLTVFEALFGSGIIAQLLLKGILTTFLTHLFAYYEPMTLHRGKVEIFGMRDGDDDDKLSKSEDASVRNFARDKHLLPLILSSAFLFLEVLIIGYSIYTSVRDRHSSTLDQPSNSSTISNQTIPINYACTQGKLNVVPL